jgi:hypothetical protein
VRRFALIAVGAAVAYILLLPAAVAWLRQPAPTPLPGPVILDRSGDPSGPNARAVDGRVRGKPLSVTRSVDRSVRVRQRRRPAAHRARPVTLAQTPVRMAPREAAIDDDDFDDSAHALDEHGDDELGDD